MTIHEFNQLNEIEQEELVWDHGFFISSHHNDDVMYDLYKIDTFYVQFSYRLNEKEMPVISSSNNLNQLNSYIVK